MKTIFQALGLAILETLATGCGSGTCKSEDVVVIDGTTYTEAEGNYTNTDGSTGCDPAITAAYSSTNFGGMPIAGYSIILNDDWGTTAPAAYTRLNLSLYGGTATSYTTVGTADGNFSVAMTNEAGVCTSATGGTVTITNLPSSEGDQFIGTYSFTGLSGTCGLTTSTGTFAATRTDIQ